MKKNRLLPVLLLTALTACSSDTAGNIRGQYEEPEETPTPTTAEAVAEVTPEAAPTEAPEETPTPTEAEEDEEKLIVAIWEYTGYIDEASEYLLQDEFINRDYDGDGTTDRVYREWYEEDQTAVYTIDFGNGRELITPTGWETGFPHVQTADITVDGEAEILFTLSYDTSTDPMSFGEMWVFEYDKADNRYKEMSLPLSSYGDGGGGKCLDLEYAPPAGDKVDIKVKQNGFTASVKLDENYLNNYWLSDLTLKDYSELRMVWSAEIKDNAIHCSVQPFYRYGDTIEFDLVYNGKALEIQDMIYVP